MKKETIEKIEDEIVKKTTMPEELKEKNRKEIFINIVLGIGIITYFIFLALGSIDSVKSIRSVDFKVFSLVLLFTAICLFEIAYKKDSGKLAINGIEILLVAIFTLFLPYIVFELDELHQRYFILGSSLIGIYYIVKSVIIQNKAKDLYEKQESDIKEITKREIRNKDILDEEIEDIEEKKEENKTTKQKKESKKDKTKKAEKENLKEENKPKKRGRPRKVVN